MVAREVDQASARIRAFQRESLEHFGLAAVAFVLALAATRLWPAFGVPLLIGGIASLVLGVLDDARRGELIDRLVGERDAYGIPAVRHRAEQCATLRSRHALAASIRILLHRSDGIVERELAERLAALADSLDDERLALDPAAAVACARLVGDAVESRLWDLAAPAEDVKSRIAQIRAGFSELHSPPARGA